MPDRKKQPGTTTVSFEVTVRGTIDLEVPDDKLAEIDELAKKLPFANGELPRYLSADFEQKFANEVADMDYEITDID